ncbi:hypothetical protein ACHAQA_003022 [Verticillium albo-atrum]
MPLGIGNMLGGNSAVFVPSRDMPSLNGKVILVTGGNMGLGKEAVLEYSRHAPAAVWLAARNLDKAKQAAEEIKKQVPSAPIKILHLDLSSLESVQEAARTFSAASDRLDILMLNAGVMATPPGLTKDGYEQQFGTNHMGHALLTLLLLPVLKRTAQARPGGDVRIISLSSYGHRNAPEGGIDFASLKTSGEKLGGLGCYGQSKLANILFVRQLAKVHQDLLAVAIHPGLAGTNLTSGSSTLVRRIGNIAKLIMPSPEQGVKHQLWASVTTKGLTSGEYYEPLGMGGLAQPAGKDDELAKKLWDWTGDELQRYVCGQRSS